MAPSSLSQAQLFGRVCKPSIELSNKAQSIPGPAPRKLYSWAGVKRKREEDDVQKSSDNDNISCPSPPSKQLKITFALTRQPTVAVTTKPITGQSRVPKGLTKTESAHSRPKLSLVLHSLSKSARTLVTLHKYFLKALSIHYAHHGTHTPAPIDRLLEVITRLWKERSVTENDLQKMLAIYEVGTDMTPEPCHELAHALSPFKLVKAGAFTSVEYVGRRREVNGPLSILFDEKEIHDSYRAHLYELKSAWESERAGELTIFDAHTLDDFPNLAVEIGTQTASRKAHISQQRAEILALSNAAQANNTKLLAAMGDMNPEELSNTITVVENRKQNLLDRIKAKQLASKTNSKPTPQQILRRHALGRIEEVTDILRMMQQRQKGDTRSSAREQNLRNFTSGAGAGKVSFGLKQLCHNIKSSARVPVSAEEVTMCLKMLSYELDGTWVRIIESRGTSDAKFVVVEGEGMTGKEVQSRLMMRHV